MNPKYFDTQEDYEDHENRIRARKYWEDEQLIALAEEQFNEFFMDKLEKKYEIEHKTK